MSNRWGKAKNRDIGVLIAKRSISENGGYIFDNERIKLREEVVTKYLESFFCNDIVSNYVEGMQKIRKRVVCCGNSQSLYCSNCCRLLLQEDEIPVDLREKSIQLPFEVLVLLTDVRNKATGLHAAALCSNEQVKLLEPDDNDWSSKDTKYTFSDDTVDTTFLLFPSEDSIPLVEVASKIKKIIVLDCKWTRTKNSGKLLPEISKYQKVHLSAPPTESYYWRWHNAGEGMLSTIEAIFYASWEVLEFHNKDQRDHNLIHLLYIFGIQRALSGIMADRIGKPSPYSKEGKEERRAQRRCIGTEKHLRDLEKGVRLREQAKLTKG